MCKDNAHLEDVKAAYAAGFRIQYRTRTSSRWNDSCEGSLRYNFSESPENYRVHPDDVEAWGQHKCRKTKPHAHAELIKAWADGAVIQVRYENGEWADIPKDIPPIDVSDTYRIKPEQSDPERYGVEVGDVWLAGGFGVLVRKHPEPHMKISVTAFKEGCTSYVARNEFTELLFRRGVVNKL